MTVVGIAGPSGAGKTSLAKKIVTVIPKSVYANAFLEMMMMMMFFFFF